MKTKQSQKLNTKLSLNKGKKIIVNNPNSIFLKASLEALKTSKDIG